MTTEKNTSLSSSANRPLVKLGKEIKPILCLWEWWLACCVGINSRGHVAVRGARSAKHLNRCFRYCVWAITLVQTSVVPHLLSILVLVLFRYKLRCGQPAVRGDRDPTGPDLLRLYHDEPGIRRPLRASGQPQGALQNRYQPHYS